MEPNLTQSLYLPIMFLIYEIIVGTLVYTRIETDKQMDGRTDRHRYRQTESVLLDRQTDGWTDRQTHR